MITDSDVIRRLVAENGRWWHEIELAPDSVTPEEGSEPSVTPRRQR